MKIVGSVLDLLLPSRCAGCDRWRRSANSGCAGYVVVRRRGTRVGSDCLGTRGSRNPQRHRRRFAAAAYDGVIRAALLDYKEHGRLCLRRELGGCLAVSVFAAVGGDDSSVVLVPVPSATATRRARGHDPVGAMAAVAASYLRSTGLQVGSLAACGKSRAVADQSGLDVPPGRRISAVLWWCSDLQRCGDVGWWSSTTS